MSNSTQIKLLLLFAFSFFSFFNGNAKVKIIKSKSILGSADMVIGKKFHTDFDFLPTDPILNFNSNGDWVPPSSLPSIFNNYYFSETKGKVRLRVLDNNTQNLCLPSNFTFTVGIEYRKYNKDGVYEGAVNKTLTVNYNNKAGIKYKAMDLIQFSNVYFINCKIVSISNVAFAPFVILDSELEIDLTRKLNFINNSNESQMKVTLSNPIKTNTIGGASGVSIDYNIANSDFADWADSVEIQWVYADNQQNQVLPLNTQTSGDFNFKNGVSVVIPYEQDISLRKFNLSNIYDKGYLFFRARAIGKQIITKNNVTEIIRVESPWSVEYDINDISYSLLNIPNIAIDRFLPKINWQYNCTYAEDGKKKEVISYFDGGFKNRQSITEANNNNDKFSIVKETVYDYLGRPAIEVLPVPTENCNLVFIENFNRNQNNLPYSAADFDINPPLNSCNTITTGMLNTSGAAKYYSPNNSWFIANSSNLINKEQFIPSSGSNLNYYPFVQTEYTPDNTGRVAKTTMPGEAYKIGSNKETRYYYAKPIQPEIDRLFGEEIGYAEHYTKEMVKDPNGQISISIKNPSGKVIATSLAGDPTLNLTPLNSSNNAQTVSENLLKNSQKSITNGYELSAQISVEKSSIYKIKYSLNPEVYMASCSTTVFCLDCAYDLLISVTDECGNEKMPNGTALNKIIGPDKLSEYNATCATIYGYNSSGESFSGTDGFVDILLSPGVYSIKRTITVNKMALEHYKANFFETAACKTLADFEQEEINKLDFSGCDICTQYNSYKNNTITSRNNYTNNKLLNYSNLTIEETTAKKEKFDKEFDDMMKEASNYCEGKSPCDAYKALLMADVSPGGLYGQTKTTDINFNRSVFNTDNTNTQLNLGHSFKDLKYFKDKKVMLPSTGYLTSLSQLTPDELVSVWQDEFAEKLIVLHPEYYQYYNCSNFQISRQADQIIGNTLTYDAAASAGYLNPVGTGTGKFHDPFLDLNIDATTKLGFQNAINQNAIAAISSNSITPSNLGLTNDINLKQLAAYLVLCKDATNKNDCITQALNGIASCDPSIKDLFWSTYKALYLAIKSRLYIQLNNDTKGSSSDYYDDGATTLNFNFQYSKLISGQERFNETSNGFVSGNTINPSFSKKNCDISCTSYADMWIAKLGNCKFSTDATVKDQQISDLKAALINVCKEGCDEKNPIGASSVRPNSTNKDKNFNDVITRLGYYEGGVCDASSLTFPPAHGLPYEFGKVIGNNCGTKLKPYLVYGGCPKTIGTCAVSNNDIATILNTIKNFSSTCPTNQICRSCQDIKETYASFYTTSSLSESDPQFQSEFTSYFNEKLSLENTFADYIAFMNNCLGYGTSTTLNTAQILEEFRFTYLIYKFSNIGLIVASLNLPHAEFSFNNKTNIKNNTFEKIEFLSLKYNYIKENKNDNLLAFNGNSYFALNKGKTVNNLMFSPAPAPPTLSTATVSDCACRKMAELKDQYNSLSSPSGYANFEAYLLALGFDVPDASNILEACKQAFDQQMDPSTQQSFDKTSQFGPEQNYLLGGLTRDFKVPCEWCNNCPPRINIPEVGNPSGDGGWNPIHDPEKDPDPKVKERNNSCDLFKTYLATHYPNQKPLDFLDENYSGNANYANLVALYNGLKNTYNINGQIAFLDFPLADPVFLIEWYKRQLCNCGIAPELCGGVKTDDYSAPCPPVGSTPSSSICTNCYAPDKKLLNLHKIFQRLSRIKNNPAINNYSCPTFQVKTNVLIGRNINMASNNIDEYCYNTLFYNPTSNPQPSSLKWKAKINGAPNYEVLQIEISDANTHKDYISLSLNNNGDLGIGFAYINNIISIRPYYIPGICGPTKHFIIEAILTYTNARSCLKKDTLVRITGTYKREVTREIDCAVKDIRICKTEPDPCHAMQTTIAKNNAQVAYDRYIEGVIEQEEKRYIKKCLSFVNSNSEVFTMKFNINQYHYTLYYYDMAGNLIKTVPPSGVKLLSETETNNVDEKRQHGTAVTTNTIPKHILTTVYNFNSLNQLTWQNTPDAGTSKFFYDQVGRLVLSQNAKQFANSSAESNKLSYTIFDKIGRINEVGELLLSSSALQKINNDVFEVEKNNFIQDNIINNSQRSEITRTHYDYNPNLLSSSYSLNNLRSRVAQVSFFYSLPSNASIKPDHAIMYSYDVTGNVTRMIRYIKGLEVLGQEYKTVDYDFDVISGKVENVYYQNKGVDQYVHHYKYDAENRLVQSYSSPRNELIDKTIDGSLNKIGLDAAYNYYYHGPLSRTVIGELQVQGLDYAYTLQGWLKGVNSYNLNTAYDMGKDGYYEYDAATQVTTKFAYTNVAKDEMGFVLNYNDLDYSQIQQNSNTMAYTNKFNGSMVSTNSGFAGYAKQLYNGNIGSMVTAIGQFINSSNNAGLVSAYNYDQLNRIAEAKYFTEGNNGIVTSTDNWNNKFTYDANGNILKQYRNGNNAMLAMDDMTYYYKGYNATGNLVEFTYNNLGAMVDRNNNVINNPASPSSADITKFTNQLSSVKDAIGVSNYSDDIDEQSVENYKYDEIGNLVYDKAEEIANIEWNLYGKIKKITRIATSSKPDLEFEYTPDGHRAVKIVIPKNNDMAKIYTYYMRDAQGNIMATYEREFLKNINFEALSYNNVNTKLIDKSGSNGFASFIANLHQNNDATVTSIKAEIENNILSNTQNTNTFLLNSDLMALLVSNENVSEANALVSSYSNYSLFKELVNQNYLTDNGLQFIIDNTLLRNQSTGIYATLPNLITTDHDLLKEYLYYIYEDDRTIVNQVFKIFEIDQKNEFEVNFNQLWSVIDGESNVDNMIQFKNSLETQIGFISIENNSLAYNYFVRLFTEKEHFKTDLINFIPDFKQMLCKLNTQQYSNEIFTLQDILRYFNNADQNQFLEQVKNSFAGGQNSLVNWFKYNQPYSFIYFGTLLNTNVITNYQHVNRCLYIPNCSENNNTSNGINLYFNQIRAYFGQSIADQILNEFLPISNFYVDKLMLNEWHIYGSSRLGIYKAEVLVASKTLTQSNGQSANTNTQGSNTNGQASNTTNPPIYSEVEPNPPIPDYASYSQIRGAKNYELSNHLGNVLVVVTDKKTYNCGNTELINANFDNGSYSNIFPITSNTSMSLSGNKLNISGTNTQVGTLFNNEGEAGRIFKVDFDLTIGSGISQVWFETNASYNSTGGGLSQNVTNSSSSGHVSFTFTAPQGAYRFKIGGTGTGTYSIDNLIVKEVGPGRYQAEIVTANDYSPFGAPMPGRSFKADNVLVKTTLSNSNFTTGTDGWVATTNATLSNVFGNIRATVTAVNAGMKKTFSTEPGKTYRVMFKINLRGWPYMYIKDKYTNTNLLSITNYIVPGDASYTFTATGYETDVIFNEATNPAGSIQLASFTLEEVESNSGYRFSYNGGEAINEVYGKDNYVDLGERGVDTRLGRLNWSIDPRAAEYPWQSPYAYYANSPIWQIDFKGGGKESTHTDKDGKVLAVYDDGDKGIYKHDDAKSKEDIDKKYSKDNTSAGGTRMGQSLHIFSFVDGSTLTPENIKAGTFTATGKIDFNSQWAKDNVNNILWDMQGHGLGYYAANARSSNSKKEYKYDIKYQAKKIHGSIYYGSLLYGDVYASARDAGNFAAGMIQDRSIVPNFLSSMGFGAYQQGELNGAVLKPPYYGEELQSGMAQELGRNYGKSGYLTVPLKK